MAIELQREKIAIEYSYKTQQHDFIDKMVAQQQEIQCKLETMMEYLEKNNACNITFYARILMKPQKFHKNSKKNMIARASSLYVVNNYMVVLMLIF